MNKAERYKCPTVTPEMAVASFFCQKIIGVKIGPILRVTSSYITMMSGKELCRVEKSRVELTTKVSSLPMYWSFVTRDHIE